MRRLLVLRPEPGASATIERALGCGLNAVAIPLFKIEAVPWAAPDPAWFDALLLTSANAVRFGGPQLDRLRILPVAAVGEATVQAARDAGFEVVHSGTKGVDALLGSIEPGLRLLHLCGEHRRVPGGQRQVITPVVVYRARAIDSPDLGAAAGAT